MRIANAVMGLLGIAHIAKSAGLAEEENIGRGLFMRLFFLQMHKHAKFAKLKSRCQSFMQMAVLRMEQKNTEPVASRVFLILQNKTILKYTQLNLKNDHLHQKILFLAFLIMQQNARNNLALI